MNKLTYALSLMEKHLKSATGAEIALWHLLKKNRAALPPLNDGFHKAFRQVDVTGNADEDMAIWHLLQFDQAPLFWECVDAAEQAALTAKPSTSPSYAKRENRSS